MSDTPIGDLLEKAEDDGWKAMIRALATLRVLTYHPATESISFAERDLPEELLHREVKRQLGRRT